MNKNHALVKRNIILLHGSYKMDKVYFKIGFAFVLRQHRKKSIVMRYLLKYIIHYTYMHYQTFAFEFVCSDLFCPFPGDTLSAKFK